MVYILRRSQSSHHKAVHSQTQLKQVKRCVIIDKTKRGNRSQRGNKGNSQKRYDVATYCGNTSPMTRSVRIMTGSAHEGYSPGFNILPNGMVLNRYMLRPSPCDRVES